jgi:hemoglobin
MTERFALSSRSDIARLVNLFYDRVRADDLLGPIFDDIAHVDWVEHLPKMYDFWESVLFGTAVFKGQPLVVHQALSRIAPMTHREFDRWVQLFHETVDQLFAGTVAEEAKMRATRIAFNMQHHIRAGEAARIGDPVASR